MSHSLRAELLRKRVDTALPVASILRTIHVIKATCVCRSTATREKKKLGISLFSCTTVLFFSFLLFGCCLLLVCLLRLSGTLNHKRTHTHTRIRLRVHMYENIFGIFVNPLGRALHLPWTRSQNEKRAHFFLTTAFFFFYIYFTSSSELKGEGAHQAQARKREKKKKMRIRFAALYEPLQQLLLPTRAVMLLISDPRSLILYCNAFSTSL